MKTGRNEPCPCGSGKKHKKCCMEKEKNKIRLEKACKCVEPVPAELFLGQGHDTPLGYMCMTCERPIIDMTKSKYVEYWETHKNA